MKILIKISAVLLCACLIAGCGGKKNSAAEQIKNAKSDILALETKFDDYSKELVSSKFLNWLESEFGRDTVLKLCDVLKKGDFPKDGWYELTGNTAVVLKDMYSGALDSSSENYQDNIKLMKASGKGTTIRIVGDVSFADNWKIIPEYENRNRGIKGLLSADTLELLRGADIFLCNNEFTYSNRGKPISGKTYTFRAEPRRVLLMLEMGADIVSLANNHSYDYGATAFADTLDTLREAQIPYIGAGEDIKEAARPYYFIVNGRKYAFTAATKAEKNIMTPEATESSSGVMRTYNPETYISVIAEAEKNCDYNITYLHWGAEGSHKTEAGLYEMGSQFIEAGADIVVGSHAHLLQGIDFYNGCPIVYNLGNFLFNSETLDTAILELQFSESGEPTYKLIPAEQRGCYTKVLSDDAGKRVIDFVQSLSPNAAFSDSGIFVKR